MSSPRIWLEPELDETRQTGPLSEPAYPRRNKRRRRPPRWVGTLVVFLFAGAVAGSIVALAVSVSRPGRPNAVQVARPAQSATPPAGEPAASSAMPTASVVPPPVVSAVPAPTAAGPASSASASVQVSAASAPAALLPGPSTLAADLTSISPQAVAAYQRLLPSDLQSIAWIYGLKGSGPALQIGDGEGKSVARGVICNPDDCANDRVAVIVAVDGSEAVAAVKTPSFNQGRMTLVGSADPATEQLVLRMLIDLSTR